MSDFITLGEPMLVWIPSEIGSFTDVTNFTKGVAGAELNVAIGIARLGHSVSYGTRLGNDVVGDYLLNSIKKENISSENILIDDTRLTGTYFKTKVKEGDPAVFYMRKNSAASAMGINDIDKMDFHSAKYLHLTGIAAAISKSCYDACNRAIEKARENNMTITFDPNIRKNLWLSEEAMREGINNLAFQCDIVLPGYAEGMLLTGEKDEEGIADFYLRHGVKTVIIKTGGSGAYYKTSDGESGRVGGFKIKEVVDSVGAGDAFAAGVISSLMEGESLQAALTRGNAMGAIMVTTVGDNDAMPTRDYLEKFIQEGEQVC